MGNNQVTDKLEIHTDEPPVHKIQMVSETPSFLELLPNKSNSYGL